MRKALLPLITTTAALILFNHQATAQNSSPYWSLAGNSNSNAASKLGTTIAEPLKLTTNNATRMYIGTNGFVGIGTTSPQARLHIVDNVNLSGYFKPLRVYNPSLATGQHVQLAFGKSNSTYNQGEINFNLVGGSGSANNTLSFGLYGQPTILTMQGTGSVGIGTSTPVSGFRLDVEGGSNSAIYARSSGNYALLSYAAALAVYGQAGNVGVEGVGTGTGSTGVQGYGDSYGVYGSNSNASSGYGVYGNGYYGVYGNSNTLYGVYGLGHYVGVWGQGNTSYAYSYGVEGWGTYVGVYANGGGFGVIGYSGSGSGYGVYGQTAAGGWAGYFSGPVYSTGGYSSSDRKLKKNITDFTSALDIINKLQPKSYEYRQDGNYKLMNLPEGKHFGLIAQDVETVLPNLVKETKFDVAMAKGSQIKADPGKTPNATQQQPESIDFKAVNYTELIPILVKGMQEQQKKIDALQAQVDKLLQEKGANTVTSMGALSQNSPNPATASTRIAYTLPAMTGRAQLLVTDNLGKTIRVVSLKASGIVEVNTATLSSGVYNYSLVVDGKMIETRKMEVVR